MDCIDSFAWTDASSDSSIMMLELEHDDLYESGPEYKKEIQEELFTDEPVTSKTKKKKRKASEMADSSPINNKKNIKTEQESDIEAPKRKKKRKNTESDNKLEFSQDQDTLLVEDYLNFRVKQEQLSFAEPVPEKKKKNKKYKKEIESGFETENSESTAKLPLGNESEISNIDDNSLNNYAETIVVKEKFEAEETVVQKKEKKKNQDSKRNTIDEAEDIQINSSKNISSDSFTNTDKPLVTNGNIESDSDFEPRQKHIKPAPESKTVNSKKDSKKSEKKLAVINSTSITDRLRFEDEESINSEKMASTASKQLQQFINMNNKLKVCKPKIETENVITDDDEVWIFRISKEVDVNDLKDLNFTLDTKWKIKINEQCYDGVVENHVSQMPFLCYDQNKCQIHNVPLMGEVSLRKRIPKAHIPRETSMINNQTNFIPLPDTKCRHPLFGVNYKKAIKIPRTIAERLKRNIDNDMLIESFSSKKEKKKHKTEKKKIEKESEPEVEIEVLQSPNPKKKKRKRKHSEMAQDTSTNKSKKSKYAKVEPDSAEAWESERAIEANLFNF